MLDKEDDHRLIEHVGMAEAGLDGATALEVYNVERQVPVLITVMQQLIRQVDILAIHEVVLIEQPYLLEGRMTQKVESTADHLYATGLVPRQPTHVVATVAAEVFANSNPWRRNSTA